MPEWISPGNKFTAKLPVACFNGTGQRLMPDTLIKAELVKRLSQNLLSQKEFVVRTEVAPTIENDYMETVSTHVYVFTEPELQELINRIIKDERQD